MSKKFSHISSKGEAKMVDVSTKKISKREATACATVYLGKELLGKIKNKEAINSKGPVLQTAIIAGTMGAKKTADLIPLCHPIGLENCEVWFKFSENDSLNVFCKTAISSKTGVEMEALTGVSIAALTIIDMCKSYSKELFIKEIRVLEKKGGKSDFKHGEP